MSNNITIELCKEDRQRIDELIAFAGLLVGELKSHGPVTMTQKVEAPAEESTVPQDAPKTETNETITPAEEVTPEPVAETPVEEPKPLVTHGMIRQKVTQLMASGDPQKKGATRSIVKAYADNVTSLPQDKWPEIWEKLTALGG